MTLPQAGGTAARQLEDAAHEVAPWIVVLARIGFLAKALLYATVGILAARAAFGTGGRTTDLGGALREVVRAPMGTVTLYVIAAGLAGYAVWRLVDAITDAEGRGGDLKGIARRVGRAVNGLVHGGLALAAFRLASGSGGGGGDRPEQLAERALDLPGGRWLLLLAAGAVIGFGLYQLYRAYAAKLGRQLSLGALSGGTLRWVIAVSRFGIGARGIVFGLIGILLARAASGRDGDQAGGTGESLEMLAGMGRWPLGLIAIGLVAYALYELLNARYRRIRVT
jgi:hypothetical protein